MRIFRFQWFLVYGLFLLSPVWGKPPGQIKIASYNLLNLVDVFDDPYTSDEQTRIKPRQEVEAVAKTILSLDADVIAFEEVENRHLLKAMAWDFMPNAGYDFIATSDTNSGRGMRVGVMSRFPILSVTSYRFASLTLPGQTQIWHFARDLMQVRLQVTPERTLDLFVIHFKSRRGSKNDPKSSHWRLAEATMTRKVIEGLLGKAPQAWVVLLGDFNDTPQSPTLKHLLGKPVMLHDVHAYLPRSQRITYLRPPYRSTIDFILVSSALAKHLVPSSALVLQDQTQLTGSDHAPLFARFELKHE